MADQIKTVSFAGFDMSLNSPDLINSRAISEILTNFLFDLNRVDFGLQVFD